MVHNLYIMENKHFLRNFYAREDINNGRQKNIDYAKMLAIIGMILIHVLMSPAYLNLETGMGYFANSILGGFLAAPVFMIAMGIGISYSKKSDSKSLIKRGFKLIALNYILNILRGLVIICIFSIQGKPLSTILKIIFTGDILLLAGSSLIAIGLFKLIFKDSFICNHIILILSIGLTIISTFTRNYTNTNTVLSYTVGFFVPMAYNGSTPVILFTFCSWFVFVGVGNYIGYILKKIKSLTKFYVITLIVSSIVAASLILVDVFCKTNELSTSYPVDQEYFVGILGCIIMVAIAMVDISVFYFVCKFAPQKLDNFVLIQSSNLNTIYIISWILIANISYVLLGELLPEQNTPLWPYLISFIIIFVLSLLLAYYWKKIMRARRIKKQNKLSTEIKQ